MNTQDELITSTYGHGGIKLTAYLSSGRIGIEVTAENAVMDWWELVEFVDRIRDRRIQDAKVSLREHLRASCDGSGTCSALEHWHGCYSDITGDSCDEPNAHPEVSK